MKKLYALVTGIFFALIVHAQNPVPSPSFETWSGADPDGWGQSDYVTRSTDAHTGSFAVKGEYSAPFTPILSSSTYGFMTNTRWAYLNFYYKFIQTSSTSISVAVYFDNVDSIMGRATASIATATAAYQSISIPITYTVSTNPSRCRIVIAMPGGASGTYFLIDDISLTMTPLIVNDIKDTGEEITFRILPNPAHSYLTIEKDIAIGSTSSFQLSDLSGRVLRSFAMEGNAMSIDVSDIPKGIYFASIRHDGIIETKKVVISR